ncbi:GyrI-like domain-containing protein [Microbacterium sp. CFH 90308]|uniref:GyrI-like domain-containing protein n=1 Tax=Microbacterium salsuginis TaxID=2722803 RepID=A0ABX1KBF6_9MICO|nr:GyrI-like domain-containing protein [Microbacterium sp. CFH 90308]NLP82746.1 GyrI-like domain-containing protein [Microbacterium sp. CFH 90308]
MDIRIADRPAFRLIGYSTRVTVVSGLLNPGVQAHIESVPRTKYMELLRLGGSEPAGVLNVSSGVDADYAVGTEFEFMCGVAASARTRAPDGLGLLDVPRGDWVIVRETPPHPVGAIPEWMAAVWFPSHPWRLRPGPSIVASRAEGRGPAMHDLWLPVEPA